MKPLRLNPGTAMAAGYVCAAFLATATPALAQGLDVQSGTSTLVQAVLLLFALIILVVCAFRGFEAVMEHRSIAPTLIGLILGLGLTLGPAWFVGKMGGGGLIPL
ncbi:MAG: hypothetical protein JWP57_4385 [Spirosoma sp.]|nr:hypothetical protein [Spirosoma sp.]